MAPSQRAHVARSIQGELALSHGAPRSHGVETEVFRLHGESLRRA